MPTFSTSLWHSWNLGHGCSARQISGHRRWHRRRWWLRLHCSWLSLAALCLSHSIGSGLGIALPGCWPNFLFPRMTRSTGAVRNLGIFRFNLIQKNSWKIFVISYMCTCHLTISATTMMNLFYETHTNKTLTQTLNDQFSYSREKSLRIPSSPLFWW